MTIHQLKPLPLLNEDVHVHGGHIHLEWEDHKLPPLREYGLSLVV